MSVITAKGKAAKESANKQGIDFKKAFIRLKDGESVRVRILSEEDFVEYFSHGHYSKGVFTQPCIEPAGEECALCEAGQYEGEKDDKGNNVWRPLLARKRYLFGFADIDEGEIRVFDASKTQAQALIAAIEEYAENLGDVAFTLKRVGKGKDTTYTLNPILKLKKADQEKFYAFDGKEVEVEFYEKCLQPRTRAKQIAELKKAGFPIAEIFGNDDIKAAEAEEKKAEEKKKEDNDKEDDGKDESEPIKNNEKDVDPEEVF